MAKHSPEDLDWTDCDNDDCDEPTPMDMIAIIADGEVFCSPGCARDALSEAPEYVALHDAQLQVDRAALGLDTDRKAIDLVPRADGFEGIDQIDDLVDWVWRV